MILVDLKKKSLNCEILLKRRITIIIRNAEKLLINIKYLFFLRDILEGNLSLENANLKQSNLAIELI